MKLKTLGIVLCCMIFFTIYPVAAKNSTVKRPLAVIQDQTYEFASVVEGSLVTHDFIIQNKGTAPLVIKKVKTG
ncbi:MAG: DUF1573 domain-containing protein [Deltaproteobacteria bacterium]|jgi:uncharacterized protein DUF1573|nr:DUF1573 domain-containing protein [Deltaproteobacteria bacterium]MBW1848783.1 DUF1573 domain-containing protein [Deltaproteobacteria bacterium]